MAAFFDGKITLNTKFIQLQSIMNAFVDKEMLK